MKNIEKLFTAKVAAKLADNAGTAGARQAQQQSANLGTGMAGAGAGAAMQGMGTGLGTAGAGAAMQGMGTGLGTAGAGAAAAAAPKDVMSTGVRGSNPYTQNIGKVLSSVGRGLKGIGPESMTRSTDQMGHVGGMLGGLPSLQRLGAGVSRGVQQAGGAAMKGIRALGLGQRPGLDWNEKPPSAAGEGRLYQPDRPQSNSGPFPWTSPGWQNRDVRDTFKDMMPGSPFDAGGPNMREMPRNPLPRNLPNIPQNMFSAEAGLLR